MLPVWCDKVYAWAHLIEQAREVGELAASMESIQRTNKFSLFLHKFYISLHKYTEEKEATLQDVFSKYDGDCDGALSGDELQRMLADLV